MFVDFDSIFHPTPEQQKQQLAVIKNIVKENVRTNSCTSCKHCIREEIPQYGPDVRGCKVGMYYLRNLDHCEGFAISDASASILYDTNQEHV